MDKDIEARFGKPNYYLSFLHPIWGTMWTPLGSYKLYREDTIEEFNKGAVLRLLEGKIV